MLNRLCVALVISAAVTGGPRQANTPVEETPVHARTGSFDRALGVDCSYCHTPPAAGPTPTPKATYDFARRMMRMVEGVNQGILQDLGPISCWTCHRGKTRPARLPRPNWEGILAEHAPVFTGERENRGISMSVYAASLGVDCSHCHVPGEWTNDSKPPKAVSRKMGELFDEIPKYFTTERKPLLQCFMCHQGAIKPAR